MRAVRDLIAYNDLKETIVDPGLCTLCGACEAACPVHALRVDKSKLSYTHDCSRYLEFCPICYDVCPFTETLMLEALGFVSDAPNRREGIGYYRKILLAQATDRKTRELSQSGGVVAALLAHAIKTGFIDSAVASEREPETPLRARPSISLFPDDLLSTVERKYFPSAVAKAFGRAVQEYGRTRIGFVGTPCNVRALRKIESWEHKIIRSLRIIIGLICLWVFSFPELEKYLKKNYGVEADEMRMIDLGKEYRVYTKMGETINIPISNVKPNVLGSCSMCSDFTSELADISVGGAHPLKDWSIVIIRTEIGEELFTEAVEGGVINVKGVEKKPEVFTNFVETATLKKSLALEEVNRRRKAGEPVPPALIRMIELLPKEVSRLSNITAGEIMTKKVVTINPETTIEDLLNLMCKHHHMGYPILDGQNQLFGIVTFSEVAKVPPSERGMVKVKDIASRRLITAYPDETAYKIHERMNRYNIGRILIVDRENPRKLLGIISKTDIIHSLR